MNPPTCFSDRSPSSGRHQYKGIYDINISILYVQCSKYIIYNIHIIIFTAAIMYVQHGTCTTDVLVLYIPLYCRLPEDGDPSLKHVARLKVTYNS